MGHPADALRSIDWTGWAPLALGAIGPLRDADRVVAEACFAQLMAARSTRGAALTALAARHGVALDDTDDAPARLGAWLTAALAKAGPDALTGPDADRFTGLVADVALWLGDRVIAASIAAGGALRWELFTSHKKATGYQRAVLVGFRQVADRHYYVDVAFMVASWAELAARRRAVKPDFLATIAQVTLADA